MQEEKPTFVVLLLAGGRNASRGDGLLSPLFRFCARFQLGRAGGSSPLSHQVLLGKEVRGGGLLSPDAPLAPSLIFPYMGFLQASTLLHLIIIIILIFPNFSKAFRDDTGISPSPPLHPPPHRLPLLLLLLLASSSSFSSFLLVLVPLVLVLAPLVLDLDLP
jgi:hypothetical protein